jgi:heme exporter protein B
MLSVLALELKYYFKNKQEAIYLYSFFISIFLLVPFSMQFELIKIQYLGIVSLWIGLACAVALGAQGIYKRDYEQGRLEYYQLLPISLESIVLAKWLSFYLFLLAPTLAALPVAALLYHMEPGQIIQSAVGLAAGAAGLSVLGNLVAVLTTGLEKAGAVLSLIMLPLSIPLMIFGAAYCRDITDIWHTNLLFLLGFTGLLLPILCFAGAYSIKASN